MNRARLWIAFGITRLAHWLCDLIAGTAASLAEFIAPGGQENEP